MTLAKLAARTCYVCGGPATTLDHAPPRVFFPEDKDLAPGEKSMRCNLHTYDACERHNNARSKADEVAAFSVVTCIENNSVAGQQIATKVLRALERRPRLAQKLVRDGREAVIDGRTVGVLRADRAALSSVFLSTAQGLYLRHIGQLLLADLGWDSPSMRSDSLLGNSKATEVWLKLASFPENDPDVGRLDGFVGDPRVFRYDLWVQRQPPRRFFFCRQWYYEGFSVLVFPKAWPG